MVKKIIVHTLKGVEHMHSRNIIHTDIKLENVLLSRHDLPQLVAEAEEALETFEVRSEMLAQNAASSFPSSNVGMTKAEKILHQQLHFSGQRA